MSRYTSWLRMANAKVLGESRDVINPFRIQHHDFERAFIEDPKTGRKEAVQRRASMVLRLRDQLSLNDSEVKALLLYKQAWDKCDTSPSRDSCDMSVKGGDGDGLTHLDARRRLNHVQAVVRAVCDLGMFESIVCHDYSMKKTAEQEFGYSNQTKIDIVRRNFERGCAQAHAYFK